MKLLASHEMSQFAPNHRWRCRYLCSGNNHHRLRGHPGSARTFLVRHSSSFALPAHHNQRVNPTNPSAAPLIQRPDTTPGAHCLLTGLSQRADKYSDIRPGSSTTNKSAASNLRGAKPHGHPLRSSRQSRNYANALQALEVRSGQHQNQPDKHEPESEIRNERNGYHRTQEPEKPQDQSDDPARRLWCKEVPQSASPTQNSNRSRAWRGTDCCLNTANYRYTQSADDQNRA